ncbi:unnamed protein product [Nesidiocoris tenuis]|uniref:Uncharacterized protein n=1 Tax=Nesidiocoris tenuis TaxID=355587 RepID=A0A6H5GS27_9HEMI|nr:unnamed protein product [Nesidiocoris tenuis]
MFLYENYISKSAFTLARKWIEFKLASKRQTYLQLLSLTFFSCLSNFHHGVLRYLNENLMAHEEACEKGESTRQAVVILDPVLPNELITAIYRLSSGLMTHEISTLLRHYMESQWILPIYLPAIISTCLESSISIGVVQEFKHVIISITIRSVVATCCSDLSVWRFCGHRTPALERGLIHIYVWKFMDKVTWNACACQLNNENLDRAKYTIPISWFLLCHYTTSPSRSREN